MDAEQAQQTGFWFGLVFGSLLFGMICGLLPWLYGRHRGREGVASVGMLACVVAGFIRGLIAAVPTAIVFAIIIALLPAPKKKKKGTPSGRSMAPRTPRQPYEV